MLYLRSAGHWGERLGPSTVRLMPHRSVPPPCSPFCVAKESQPFLRLGFLVSMIGLFVPIKQAHCWLIWSDRGAGYRKAATKSAPRAQQVLDRWHVLKEKSGRSDPENVSATDRRAPSSRRAGETEHSTDMPCSNWVCPS